MRREPLRARSDDLIAGPNEGSRFSPTAKGWIFAILTNFRLSASGQFTLYACPGPNSERKNSTWKRTRPIGFTR